MKNIPIRHIKGVQQESRSSESFSIRDVVELLAGKDMVQELHRHDFFYILALQKGKGIHEIDFTSYAIRDYSVFFLRPGQVHQLILKAESRGYMIAFKMNFYAAQDKESTSLLRKVSSINQYQLEANYFKKLFSVLTSLFHEYTDKQEGYQKVLKANLDIFFVELIRQNNKTTPVTNSTYAQEQLEKLSELIEKNISSHKQVTEYAGMLNLSPYQLNAITKTMLGKTCSEFINDFIILEAKRYLLATSNQITQVAYHLGYEDVSYFIRFFKNHTGHSPEAFRNNFS